MSKKESGQVLNPLMLKTIKDTDVLIPHATQLTHLQFRRYAGCPMCNLHLHSFIEGHSQLIAHNIQEVVIFHSSQKALLAYQADAPFAIIADPKKSLYKQFGVESSLMALLHPYAWPAMMKGMLHRFGLPAWGESMIGLPADFLIDTNGRILACHYGRQGSDQWQLSELIDIAKPFSR